MSFDQIVETSRRENLLFSVLVELTYRCNLDCFFCYNDVGLEGRALSREQYLQLFDDLAEMGVLNLILSGGEPTAHPDFFELGAAARERGFVVRVKSNGHALRGALARRLKEEVDPFLVEISLHGASAESHDRQTRVPGSFDRLMENIPELGELGLRVNLNATLTAWNEDEMEQMKSVADELGVPLRISADVSPRDDGDASPLSIQPSAAAVDRLYALQAEERARHAAAQAPPPSAAPATASAKHCGAGSTTVAIDPYGTVYPCVQWRRSVGNLHRSSMREIWSASVQLAEVRDDNRRAKRFVDTLGDRGRQLGFCPGAAVRDTGAADRLYPDVERRLGPVHPAPSAGRSLLPVLNTP